MRKNFLLILILSLFFFNFSVAQIFADDASQSPSLKKVSYELPYPGLLPDNPLYALKAARDRVVSMVINDPLKKSEFDLLNSDKRVNAGYYLVLKNKDALGVSTVSKSNNYMFEAIAMLRKAKEMKKDTGLLNDRMKISIQKHLELVKDMEKSVDKAYLAELNQEYKKLKEFEVSVNQLGKK